MNLSPLAVGAIGVAGLLGIALYGLLVARNLRPALAQRMEASVTGASLRRAQSLLDELGRFERE